ncbi:MAG: TerB family tellurite resistance protein [Candidatus Pelagibacter sp.]|tara:strand:- start:242 stop:676 length:435 start_codon:yes stop_codon:yes gene_type:complete
MFNLFKKNENDEKNDLSLVSVASILIHSAKIDENFTDKEKNIIKNALIEMGAEVEKVDKIIKESEKREQDSNQILDFTKDIKNIDQDKKKLIIEALWNIIYSDKNADMYEANLMRRLAGLLYLDNKVVGDLKEKVRKKHNDISS